MSWLVCLMGRIVGNTGAHPLGVTTMLKPRRRLLPDTVLPPGLTTEETREAARALRGTVLRRETYALDGRAEPGYPNGHPYQVVEQTQTVHLLQSRGLNRHAVFLTHARESLTAHYERIPDDPRLQHQVILEVDPFGD